MARLFCSIAERRINLQISSQSHYSRKALNISEDVWVCRKTQQLKLRGSVGINSNCPHNSRRQADSDGVGDAVPTKVYTPSDRAHTTQWKSAGVIEVLELELWTPPELPTSSAGPHILYTICYILKNDRRLNVFTRHFLTSWFLMFIYLFFNIYESYIKKAVM